MLAFAQVLFVPGVTILLRPDSDPCRSFLQAPFTIGGKQAPRRALDAVMGSLKVEGLLKISQSKRTPMPEAD